MHRSRLLPRFLSSGTSPNATAEREARRRGRLALLDRAIIFAPMRHREKARARSLKRLQLECEDRRDGFQVELARIRANLPILVRYGASQTRSLNRESASIANQTRLHARAQSEIKPAAPRLADE